MATRPCPDGHGSGPRCRCTPIAKERYWRRISGPLLDRIDIHLEVPAVRFRDLTDTRAGEPSEAIRARVAAARSAQQERFHHRRGVHANAVHPGAIVTELGRHLSSDDIAALQARAPGGKGFHWKSIEAGAATSVWAATTPQLEGKGGLYLEDCHVARPRRSADDEEGHETYALDPEAAERLWHASEEMIGTRFDPAP